MENVALVLEGGGMRGIFTAGVLDGFIEKGVDFPYIIGVSMGAYTGASYVAKQKFRNKKVLIESVLDKDFINIKNFFTGKSLLHSDYIFTMMNKFKHPFDYDTFNKNNSKFLSVATDVESGLPYYFEKSDMVGFEKTLKASCAYPGITNLVEINEKHYIDGGVSDPVPYKKALADGNEKLVVVLTHPKGYVEKAPWYLKASSIVYKKHPKLVDILKTRHEEYNQRLKELEKLEEEGKVFIIRPEKDLSILSKDIKKLNHNFEDGYKKAMKFSKNLH